LASGPPFSIENSNAVLPRPVSNWYYYQRGGFGF
jgi:hypothetical protein